MGTVVDLARLSNTSLGTCVYAMQQVTRVTPNWIKIDGWSSPEMVAGFFAAGCPPNLFHDAYKPSSLRVFKNLVDYRGEAALVSVINDIAGHTVLDHLHSSPPPTTILLILAAAYYSAATVASSSYRPRHDHMFHSDAAAHLTKELCLKLAEPHYQTEEDVCRMLAATICQPKVKTLKCVGFLNEAITKETTYMRELSDAATYVFNTFVVDDDRLMDECESVLLDLGIA